MHTNTILVDFWENFHTLGQETIFEKIDFFCLQISAIKYFETYL